ncbi:hypothetical protein K502DRAFT_364289 [Neoconidiobolus thromboides FSU 785]|nr:hypothetical protein K502DRAFT_364289 [Neoconidiobolus thromboides FSU 785]
MTIEEILFIKDIIKYLDLNKLNVFKTNVDEGLCLDGLEIIKKEFNRLKVLHLMASIIYSNYDEFSPDFSFTSNVDLEISEGINFDIEELGNLKQLRSIKLIYYYSVLLSPNDNVEHDMEICFCI